MADVQGFRGIRFDLGRVGTLSDVIAPPYDVIDSTLQSQLYEKSPYNVVRLILNRDEASDTEGVNRYTRAAGFVRDWLRDGILKQDSARGLYVCQQEFEVEGRRFRRQGFLARVRLQAYGSGSIFPHEETMAGPKADRLQLFRATRMNLSPVFGLYADEGAKVEGLLDAATRRALPLEAVDHLGVISRIWPVTNQATVSAVTGLMGPRPIFIADGHHRYETGLRYLEERRAAGDAAGRDAAPNFILMMLVRMNDPGLLILPTHRLISGVVPGDADSLRNRLANYFDLEKVGKGGAGASAAWEIIEAEGDQTILGFGTAADDAWQVARFRGASGIMEELAPEHSLEWRRLGVSLLHVLVFGRLIEASQDSIRLRYVHRLTEVQEALDKKECPLAALVPPATTQDVSGIAGRLEKMPAKSTYFFPKLLSGLVFNSLSGN